MAGNGASKLSGRFIPLQPQLSSTDNSCQNTDNSNTTTVYHEKSTGGCQNKMTGMQMSPRDPRPTGTNTATQMSSQAGGTQTTPPPSPKKTTSTGGTQTSPPKDNSCEQVDQGQLYCNWDKEGQQTGNASSRGKKGKKSSSEIPPHPGSSRGSLIGPRNNFMSRNLGTGRPTIQSTAWGEYSHWGRKCPYDNYCTMCNNHDTCAGLTDRPTTKVNRISRVHLYVSTVELLSTVHPIATGDLGTTENNHVADVTLWEGTSHLILKFWEMPLVGQLLWVLIHMDDHLSPNFKGSILKIWKIPDQITDLQSFSEILIILLITGSHRDNLMQGLTKDTTRGTHPLYFHWPHN